MITSQNSIENVAKKIALESVFDIEGDVNTEVFEALNSDYSAIYDHLIENNDATFVIDDVECVFIPYPRFIMPEDAIEMIEAIFNHTVANISQLQEELDSEYVTLTPLDETNM